MDSRTRFVRSQILRLVYRRTTAQSLPIYTRGDDYLSFFSNVLGAYEPELIQEVREISQTHGDFLVDVGANIGIFTHQLGSEFKRYELVEPNPLVCNILRTNVYPISQQRPLRIHEFGLSKSDCRTELHIPPNNFAGAFILDGNPYGEDLLATKEGFTAFKSTDYLKVEVELRDSDAFFAGLFGELHRDGCRNGVIKVDVEGFEVPILRSILNNLPDEISIAIVFENHDLNFDATDLFVGPRVKSVRTLIEVHGAPAKRRFSARLARRLAKGWEYRLVDAGPGMSRGNLVALIDAVS